MSQEFRSWLGELGINYDDLSFDKRVEYKGTFDKSRPAGIIALSYHAFGPLSFLFAIYSYDSYEFIRFLHHPISFWGTSILADHDVLSLCYFRILCALALVLQLVSSHHALLPVTHRLVHMLLFHNPFYFASYFFLLVLILYFGFSVWFLSDCWRGDHWCGGWSRRYFNRTVVTYFNI